MRIGLIIPTYNRKQLVLNLLSQLFNQENIPGLEISLFVIVDGSTDGTHDAIISSYPNVKIIMGDGQWYYTKCLNEGCKAAIEGGNDHILTMNDDCEITKNFLASMVGVFKTLPTGSALGASTITKSDITKVTFLGAVGFNKFLVKFKSYLKERRNVNPSELTGTHPSFSLMTRGLLFSVKTGEDIHFFDEKKFPQYGSDEDFSLRLIEAGHQCFVTWDVQITDFPELSSKGSAVNRPSFSQFINSFFSPYSINSISKTVRFQLRHGYVLFFPLALAFFIAGTFYSYLWKYRLKNT